MKKMRRIICLLLALVMVFTLFACQKAADPTENDNQGAKDSETTKPAESTDSQETDDSQNAGPVIEGMDIADVDEIARIIVSQEEFDNHPHAIQEGTELTVVNTIESPNQLPWNATTDGDLTTQIYEGLLYVYLADPTDVRGAIAETWDHSDDYLTWTFQIRNNVKFADGTVCDAKAVEKAWQYYYDASPSIFNQLNIVSWEATGDYEFVVKLSAPCSYFQQNIAKISVVSPTALDTYGIEDNRAAVGTGPYYIAEYTSGVGYVLKANKDYYLEEKYPAIETINMKIIKDKNTIMFALLNGEVDAALVFNDMEYYYNLKDSGFDGFTKVARGQSNTVYLNAHNVPEFAIKEVRQAFGCFLDLESINEMLYDGTMEVSTGMYAEGTSGYVKAEDFEFNPEKGLALLESVGVEPSDIEFTATIHEKGRPMMEAIQDQLNKYGFKMSVEVLEPAANLSLMLAGEWTITFQGGYLDSQPYYPYTSYLTKEQPLKSIFQDEYDPDLYAKIIESYEAMKTSTTWDEMVSHCHEITSYIQNDYCAYGLLPYPYIIAISNKVKNPVYTTENRIINLCYLYY